MSYAVYVYADADRNQDKIGSNEINWTGTWAASGSYFASSLDTVMYGVTRYIAVIDNAGVNPTAKLPNKRPNPFSQLVVIQPGDEPPFSPPQTEDRISEALQTAWAGTNLAYTALQTAWAGTSAAATAYGTVPYSANQAGTIYYDFKGSAYQETTVVGPLWVSGTNMGAVGSRREIAVVLVPDGSSHLIGFSAFKWFGTTPPATIVHKEVVITMTAVDASLGNVKAVPIVQV